VAGRAQSRETLPKAKELGMTPEIETTPDSSIDIARTAGPPSSGLKTQIRKRRM
jgi:hypothetical protein